MFSSLGECFNRNFTTNPIKAKPFSENAIWLLEQRYFMKRWFPEKEHEDKETTCHEVARRVSRTLAAAESNYSNDVERVINLERNIAADMEEKRFLFNSPCLFSSGAGLISDKDMASVMYCDPSDLHIEDYHQIHNSKTDSQQLFACFVINIPDSIEGIFSSVKDAAIISKFGGGVGGNFGHLREKSAPIRGGVASGPVSFMELWNTMGTVVVQGGHRRAALMGMIPVDHPDIHGFINAKTEEGKLAYFNISCAVTDKLIEAMRKNEPFELISRQDGHVTEKIPARDLWNELCEAAWKRGDPGVFFVDRANHDSLLRCLPDYQIESTNPCGEQPLPNYTSCNLGSINLSAFVDGDPRTGGAAAFDWDGFVRQVARSMYYLDLVIDATVYPLRKIGERTTEIRPVGLGLMGLADVAIKLGLVYGSVEFNEFCDRIVREMSEAALLATCLIVKEAGKSPFVHCEKVKSMLRKELPDPNYCVWRDEEAIPMTFNNTLSALLVDDTITEENKELVRQSVYGADKSYGMRNSRRLSFAPTGSISMLFDASAGIEPNFAWSWTRRVNLKDGGGTETRDYYHPLLTAAEAQEISTTGKLSDPLFVNAYDVSPDQHVDVTGIFAQYVDSGISKTVNLPFTATVEDVKSIYERCYDLGCKGITIYRDGSRNTQPIETKKVEKHEAETAAKDEAEKAKTETVEDKVIAEEKTDPAKVTEVPDESKANYTPSVVDRSSAIVAGLTIKDKTPWGSLWVTLNYDHSRPFETFINLGKSGSELKAMTEALGRIISIGLRSGCHLEDFIQTLRGISGKEVWMSESDDEHYIRSIPDAIGALLNQLTKKRVPGITTGSLETTEEGNGTRDVVCPECGSPMELIGGCEYCFSCGYSPCK